MKIFLLISVLFMMMSIQLIGQNLIDSRKSSYITYIYKIKDSELESLYKKDISDLEDSYYHSLVDSFYTDSTLQKKLDYGHYLFVSAVKGDLKIEAKSFNNTDVRVINNKNDLQIVVFSKKGERIANALVYVKNRKLKFDKKSGSYTIDKSNNFGVIKVFYDGNWSFYSLSRSRNNTFVVRAGKFLLFSPPLKYLWTPLRDLYRSIRYWEIPSFVYKITNLFTSNTNDYSNKFTGYIAFNKPKFKPGDTVKLKAFVVRKNGKPINKELTLRVGNYRNKYKSFGAISPYRKGAYSYEFVLHDSLDFTLDLQQVVMLQNIQNKTVIENRFEFEDYELKSTSYTLRSENRENRVDESMVLYAKGVDENDMNLLDARIKLNVLSKRLESYSSESIFIPDTLWNYEQQLDPLGETKIILPDSIFPPTSLGYKVEALFLNSNNEFHSKTVDLKYIHENKQFQFKLKNDSLYINYLRSGKSVIHTAKLIADAKDETIFEQEIKLPYKMVINPYIDYYYITDGENQNHYWIDEVESSVIPITYRTKDSVYISLENLHKIPIWYTIYAGKNRVKRGSKNEALDFVFKSKTSKPYFLSIQYLWGNEIREEEYSIPFYEKKLNITIDQPEVIYPGQIAEINIDVKNQRGEPVPNVDLTAYSYTNKFNNEYFSPEAPYLGEVFGNRPIFNTFSLREKIQGTYSSSLIWDKWGKQLGLDSIEYYNFLYPEKQFYKAQISTPDSSTQFAPFYMENGKIKPIHILYIDNIPIYYRGTNTVTNYSFKIDDLENHQLKIRTANKLFKIDSIALIHGVKNVFSFSNNINDKDVRIEDAPYILSDQEKRVLQRHLVLVDDNFKDNFAYIKQYDNVQLLGSIKNNWRGDKLIVGPFFSDSTSFTLMEKFTTHFVYEPSYEYQFHKNLLKMKYRDDFNQLNHYLNNGQTDYELGQVALTEAKIKENWKFHLDNKNRNRTKYYNPSFTTNGYGRLYYQYHKKDSLREMGIYIDKIIMLNKADPNFLRVYKGSERTLHQLAPDSYRLIFLLNNQTYFTLDSIHVLANGGRYLSIVNPNIQPNDSLIHNMLNIVRIKTGGHNFIKGELDRDIRQVKQLAYKKYHNPFDRYVTGTVTSIDDGSTMPGVNVVVKGTTIGTITDIDGNYMLYLPKGGILTFSFVGLTTEEIEIGNRSIIDVAMASDVMQLSEVIVTGMGVSRVKRSMGYSVSTLLQGKVAGVQVSSPRFMPSDEIKIRGNSSIEGNNSPLIIIDGIPQEGVLKDFENDKFDVKTLSSEEGMAIYGARASNGVVVITTKKGGVLSEKVNKNLMKQQNSPYSSIRNNFSDYAFWKPNLVTNQNGKTMFKVKFPDDVTNWKTVVIGMDSKKHTGQIESSIKSYKSIMANLAIPQFMTTSDTINIIGKVLNYSRDTLDVKTTFTINGKGIQSNEQRVITSLIDSVKLTSSSSDTVKVRYSMEQSNGYFDGEERSIPVYKIGISETKGNFHALVNDTTLSLSFDSDWGDVTLYANANTLDVLENEIENVRRYPYLCNEQMASKLHTLLAQKKIKVYKSEKFNHDFVIKSFIRKLERSQKENGMWGWWSNSSSEFWITNHVLQALFEAKNQGYHVKINTNVLVEDIKWNIENMDTKNKVSALSVLHQLGVNVEFKGHISRLEKEVKSVNEYLILLNLKTALGYDVKLDSLIGLKKETMLGNVYWDSEKWTINDNSFENTILAYQLFSNNNTYKDIASRTRGYLMEMRGNGYWRNTFESARAINVLLSDSLLTKGSGDKSVLKVNGVEIKHFPVEQTMNSLDKVVISKSGNMPVYVSTHQQKWIDKPLPVTNEIGVNSYFDKAQNNILKAGIPVTLIVEVNVTKKSDYVMIEVPVPAGCSYQNKSINYSKEDHREYYKHKVNIYARKLGVGSHQFKIDVIPRYTGSYTINPVKAELMYYPTFFGRNDIKKVKIK